MKLIIFILFFFIITPIASASLGIFDVFNETEYKGSLNIVTEYQDPDKTVQSHKHIQGWIDIVGFKDAVMYNETFYINGSEDPTPVIKYWIRRKGISKKSVNYLKIKDKRVINSNGITTVELDILLKWHSTTTTHYSDGSTSKGTSSKPLENLTLSTSIKIPQSYPKINKTNIKIIIYDNMFNPHVDIHIPVQPFETKTEIIYQNETITRHTKSGFAAIGAVNLSDCLFWEGKYDNLKYRNEMAIIDNIGSSNFNPKDLEITTISPYESITQTNYSITVVQFDTSGGMNPSVLTHILILLIFTIGAKKCFSAVGDMI